MKIQNCYLKHNNQTKEANIENFFSHLGCSYDYNYYNYMNGYMLMLNLIV